MAIGGKGRLVAGNWEPSRAGALQLLSGEIRPVPQYGRNPLFVNLVAPAGPVEIRERQPHQQIAEWSRIENASVVDDGEAIHLNSPCKAPDQFSLSPDSLWRAIGCPEGFPASPARAPKASAESSSWRRCGCGPGGTVEQGRSKRWSRYW